MRVVTREGHKASTPPKTNMVHLKMGAPWNLGDSYWKPSFPGSMLLFGGVSEIGGIEK